jgi:hypothetical protein
MATLKSNKAQAGEQPRQVHAGTNSIAFTYSVTANLSVGDVIQLAKIPDGAIVDYIKVWHTTGNIAFDIGDGGDTDRYIDSASIVTNSSVVADALAGRNYQIDVTDGAADQFDTIDMTILVVTTATAAGAISGVIQYHCDEAPA